MRRIMPMVTAVALVVVYTATPAVAHWLPGDGYTMHFPQLPDEEGWDVNATFPLALADDWQCIQTGFVDDFHFWGSWRNGNVGTITHFTLSIHSNDPGPPSRPDVLLWMQDISDFDVVPIGPTDPPTWQGWYDPELDTTYWNDHQAYFQYNIVDVPDPFLQVRGHIYWLNISAHVVEDTCFWGWKTSRDHWMDDAVWALDPIYDWQPMIEPPRYNEFRVSFDGAGFPTDEGSTNYYSRNDTIWWHYDESNWWNIWFYNNPYKFTNPKHIFGGFDIISIGPSPYARFAVNFIGYDFIAEFSERPPLPDDCDTLCIVREFDTEFLDFPVLDFDFELWIPFNPEWVSIDFIAQDVFIDGYLYHECENTSMDLAFVVTYIPPPPFPTLSEWGLLIFVLLMIAAGIWALRRRKGFASLTSSLR